MGRPRLENERVSWYDDGVKKGLCWIQLIAITLLVLMAPCMRCEIGVAGAGYKASYTSDEHQGECEDHHNCTSISCSCHGGFYPLPTGAVTLEPAVVGFVGFSAPIAPKAAAIREIFQPPKSSNA